MSTNLGRPVTLALLLLFVMSGMAFAQDDAETLRQIEHERVRALVNADMDAAERIHADDFLLVNPAGIVWSKEQYLSGIDSGAFNYRVWNPDTIEVLVYEDAAVMRYQSELEIVVLGQEISLRRYWHTDLYERRDGNWQAVWSQATEISGSD